MAKETRHGIKLSTFSVSEYEKDSMINADGIAKMISTKRHHGTSLSRKVKMNTVLEELQEETECAESKPVTCHYGPPLGYSRIYVCC